MKAKMNVTELSHDDIVLILSDLCSDCHFYIDKVDGEEYEKAEDDCFEDILAKHLLNGGNILVIDNDAEGEVYGNLPHNIDELDSVEYTVSYQDFLKGMQCDEALPYVMDMINENGDYWTSYNLIQCVLFGEIIYG